VEAQRRLVHATRRHYDVILVDTAPLLSTNDAIDLAPLADLVVVVARYGETKTHHARRTSELLARMRATVGGVVFVATPRTDDGGYGYYYSSNVPLTAVAEPGTPTPTPTPVPTPTTAEPIASDATTLADRNGAGNGNGAASGNGHASVQADGTDVSWHSSTDQPS
jgi:hypothetical protein